MTGTADTTTRASVHELPVERRATPFSDGGWMPSMEGAGVTHLRRPRLWAEPKRSPEMELILALIEALKERSGTKTIGTSVLMKLGDALHKQTDHPDAPRVWSRTDPSVHAAVNALCGGR